MLEINTKAPDFTLQDQNGNAVSLHDYLGKKVILYFYSKDNTSGCTKQTCAYNSLVDEFAMKGVEVIGISKDSVSSHQKFSTKYDLKFTILADPDKTVLQAYDVLKEKTMYGKKVMGTVRSSYLIDENGMIIAVKANVRPDTNAQDMLELV
ncbi:MAG: peroxiredoxin [Bulleidia sp.]